MSYGSGLYGEGIMGDYDSDLLIFPNEFVPHMQGAPYHAKWVRANPVEASKWATFRADVIAGKQVTPPTMSSKYGKALVAAGKEHMSISHFVGTVTNPYPPPDPPLVEPPPPPPPPPPGVTPIYTADFETGDFSQVVSQQESSASRITIVPAIASWGGNWSAKTLIGPTDQGVAGGGTGYRTEILVSGIPGRFGWSSLEGHESWITWNNYIDPNFELSNNASSWLYFNQFWTQGLETGSPCLGINAAQGQMYLTLRGGTSTTTQWTRVIALGLVPKGQLLRWKAHHIWASSGSSGLVQLFLNGVLRHQDTLPNCAQNLSNTTEFKIGTYRSGIDPPTRDSYTIVDNIKFWTADPVESY